MSWRSLALLLLALPLTACFDDKDDDDDDDDDDSGWSDWTDADTDVDGDTDTDADGDSDADSDLPSVSVTWGSSAVTVDISGGPGAWWFGMAETQGCDDCWTGEDCVYGYELPNGTSLSWCHDGTDTGTRLEYGGNPNNLATGDTVFNQDQDGKVAYFLESDPDFGGDGSCYIWGPSASSYYGGLGCQSL